MRLVPVDLSTYYRKTKNYYILEEFVNSGLSAALIEDYPQKNCKNCSDHICEFGKTFWFQCKSYCERRIGDSYKSETGRNVIS